MIGQAPYYPSTTQTIAVASTSAAITNAVGNFTHVVRLLSSVSCFVVFAGTPTATTSDMKLISGVPEYFVIKPGQKVAAIRESSDGTLWVTEMTR